MRLMRASVLPLSAKEPYKLNADRTWAELKIQFLKSKEIKTLGIIVNATTPPGEYPIRIEGYTANSDPQGRFGLRVNALIVDEKDPKHIGYAEASDILPQ